MNNALTADDVTDLAAIKAGVIAGHGGRRNLRTSELEDGGARLVGLELAAVHADHVELTEAGHVELEERGA